MSRSTLGIFLFLTPFVKTITSMLALKKSSDDVIYGGAPKSRWLGWVSSLIGMSSHDNMKMTLYTLQCEKNGGHEP